MSSLGQGDKFVLRRESGVRSVDLTPVSPLDTRPVSSLSLFHSTRPMTNEELRRRANTHGYVLPENSYQYRSRTIL